MPQVSDYQVDPLLTNVSVAYESPELIATMLFPRVEVPARNGYYYKFDKSKFRIENAQRTGVSRANRVGFGMSKQSYGPLAEQSLEEPIEYEVRDNYPTPYDARVDATEDVTYRLDLAHEKSVATILTSTGTITQNVTLSGTDQWSDFANSDPFNDIQTGFDTIQAAALVTANTLVLGYQVWAKLKNHPDLLGRLSVSTVRTLTTDLLAALIGVERVLVGKAMENTAKEGQTDSLSYVWGKNAILCYVTGRPGIKSMNVGYTLQMKGARYVDRWDEPWNKAEFVRANDYYEAKVVAAEAAYLMKSVVA